MPVYMIIESRTKDSKTYAEYIRKVPPIISKHGGRYIARTSDVTPGAGGWTPERLIILEFPSRENITRCFSSAEYQEIASLREKGADTRAVIVDGCTQGPATECGT